MNGSCHELVARAEIHLRSSKQLLECSEQLLRETAELVRQPPKLPAGPALKLVSDAFTQRR